MWYLPRYEELTEPLRAAFQTRLYAPPPADLPVEELDRIRHLLPDYAGGAEPAVWNRTPGKYLNPRRLTSPSRPSAASLVYAAECGIFINQTYDQQDPAIAEVLRNRNFKQALSLAMNRAEINEVIAFNFVGDGLRDAADPYK